MTNLLRRIAGRIKNNMEQIGLTIVAISIPTGLTLFIIGISDKDNVMQNGGIGMVLLGFLALFVSLYYLWKKDRKEDLKFYALIKELRNVNNNMSDFINEIRQERNERNNNKPKS
jgi:hypothetical protein